MTLRMLCRMLALGASAVFLCPPSPTTAADAKVPAAKREILFVSKSSGFEHSVISWKNGQPSWAEKQLLELVTKNGWEFTFHKDGSLFSPEYLKGFDAVLAWKKRTGKWMDGNRFSRYLGGNLNFFPMPRHERPRRGNYQRYKDGRHNLNSGWQFELPDSDPGYLSRQLPCPACNWLPVFAGKMFLVEKCFDGIRAGVVMTRY